MQEIVQINKFKSNGGQDEQRLLPCEGRLHLGISGLTNVLFKCNVTKVS